ncbi:Zinc finger, RING-type [Dillenia turbinata]|uniref:RING-type E3 ubiquitin transferase n=1 Tax=Dillenia turbinata TaxID=194707 RepID=A0AAN8VK33_9MAGN
MNFVFRGTRGDLESGLPGYIPERRVVRLHAARPAHSNSLAFLLTGSDYHLLGEPVILLFMILNSHQMSPNFMLWVVLGIFLMATSLRMYATCQQLQAQAQAAHALATSGLLGHTELRLQMPPSIALAARGRLHGLRLQLALLDRDFDALDYETLRALDSENVPQAPAMSEEEINALPVHMYKVAGAPSYVCCKTVFPMQTNANVEVSSGKTWWWLINASGLFFSLNTGLPSSLPTLEHSYLSDFVLDADICVSYWFHSFARFPISYSVFCEQKKQESNNAVGTGSTKAADDELTCTVCLEQVNDGELVRSLPCLHKFHASCIDPWLRQQGTCPVCKFRAGSQWQEHGRNGADGSYMV